MSDFDQFDAMGDDDFFGTIPTSGGAGSFEDEDADMFSMFEEGARNESAGFVNTAGGTVGSLGTNADFGGIATQPALVSPSTGFDPHEPAAAPQASSSQALGSKRPREEPPTSKDTRPISQDFGVLHSDPLFKSLFTTPESIVLATPIVVNCIGLVYLGCGVDLRALSCSVRNVEYNCSRAPRAVLRLVEPHCSAIIRSNGVVTIVGSGSVQATKTAAELTARIIRCALGLTDLLAIKFRLRTLMVRFDLQRPVRIGNLAAENPGVASYEPETFCACILRLTGTIYSDGKTFEDTAAQPQDQTAAGDGDGVGAPPPEDYPVAIPTGAHQSEVDDFFGFGSDGGDFDMGMGGAMALTSSVAQTAPASTTQAQARVLSAIRWTISANVFVSGKVTMIGAKSVDEVAAAYSKLLRLVRPHMKVD